MLVPEPRGVDVLNHLGWPAEGDLLTLAGSHVSQISRLARAYTRGKGWHHLHEDTMEDDIAAVILSASSRSLCNPTQARRIEAGSFNSSPTPFVGWNLIEATVLNRYRRRQS